MEMKNFRETPGTSLLKPPPPPPPPPPAAGIDKVSLFNLIFSLLCAQLVFSLPFKRDAAGNRYPTLLFKDQPNSLEAFVLLVMFGFSTSLCGLYSYQRPRLAKVFRVSSAAFLSCAASVLTWSTVVLLNNNNRKNRFVGRQI